MSEDLMYQIAHYAEIGDLRTVRLLVWNYYARNDYVHLRRAVNGWYNNSAFATRQKFFNAALKNHIEKIYEASTSVLMSHIEGIAGEFFYKNVVKKGIRNTGIKLQNSEKLVLYMLNKIGDVQNLNPEIIGFMGWIMVKSIVQYAEWLYRFVDFEQDFEKVQKSSTLHRHGSAHGIQLGFPTAMNSLRLFLLFDIIHYMLESYENHGRVIWI